MTRQKDLSWKFQSQLLGVKISIYSKSLDLARSNLESIISPNFVKHFELYSVEERFERDEIE